MMSRTPFGKVLAALSARDCKVRQRTGGKAEACCPACDDRGLHLSIAEGDDGRVLLHCFHGCSLEAILTALNLPVSDLFGRDARAGGLTLAAFAQAKQLHLSTLQSAGVTERTGRDGRLCLVFPYRDEDGREIAPRFRYAMNGDRRFGWPRGTKAKGLLYGRERLPDARRSGFAIMPEGESDCLTCWQHGLPAVGVPGADVVDPKRLAKDLAGIQTIYVVNERDRGGLALLRELQQADGLADRVRVLDLSPWGAKDPSELHCQNPAQFVPRMQEAMAAALSLSEALAVAADETPAICSTATADRAAPTVMWPGPPATEAFDGLAGEFVMLIDPHTESDPAALLLQLLVAFGSVIGRTAHFEVEATQHFGNLFLVLTGDSARARKGTSASHVLRAFETVDATWSDRVIPGLSSGEGLIWAVRDQIEKQQPVRDKQKHVTGYETVIEDPGIQDKRLLAFEPEFASVLRVMQREGNTLSPVIREAWDVGTLQVLTKNSPAKATGAHVSIIGHITAEEVLRYLDSTEAGNGFANRFLWACVRRSKLLPEGGRLHTVDLAPFLRRLGQAVRFAQSTGCVTRTSEAAEVWEAEYPVLTAETPGLLGAVTARAEAQTMRLALLYALLDCSPVIDRPHLESGMAVWRYCEASARCIFGDTLGDPLADELLRLLRQSALGLTRTEISNHFGRNREASKIARALGMLQQQGLADYVRGDADGGRPSERWYAAGPGQRTAHRE